MSAQLPYFTNRTCSCCYKTVQVKVSDALDVLALCFCVECVEKIKKENSND